MLIENFPLELFLFGMTFSMIFAFMGLYNKPRIHWLVLCSGLFVSIFALLPSNLIMGYSDKSSTDTLLHYNIQSSTGQVLINSVTAHSRGERLSTTSSSLEGDTFDCITVYLGRSGSPPNTTLIRVGVMDTSTVMVKQFGSMNVTALLTSSVQPYTFCLPIGDTYTFSDTETFGIQYNDGDGSNTLTSRVDGNNPFDGSNTEHVHATASSWISNTGEDIMMILSLRGNVGIVEPITYEYTDIVKTVFLLMGAFICITSVFLIRSEP